MAGAYRWKGSIRFGLLTIPVIAKSAIDATDIAFNKHHAADGGRLRQGPMTCEVCQQLVGVAEQCRGYQGHWPVDDEYLKALEAEKSDQLTITQLVPMAQIDPRYFQKSYDVTPNEGSEKLYVLFL